VKLFAALAALVSVAVAVAIYFGTRTKPAAPPVPRAQQTPILEQARAKGVIAAYRPVDEGPASQALTWSVNGGQITFQEFGHGCAIGDQNGPACVATSPLLTIEYRHSATRQAEAIMRIAHAQLPNAKVRFWETTTLGG
jgi:hypothetical protein